MDCHLKYFAMRLKLPYRHRVLVLLFFLILITYLDRVCISLVGVRIKTEFHLNNEQFGWVLGAFALAYALFEIPSGVLGDRIGQRAVLIRIVLVWSIFTALTGVSTGLLTLIITRFLFGVGESGAFPNSTAIVSRWFPAAETGRGMSALLIGLNAGAAIAPVIIIPIAILYGWRAPFFVNALIGMIWVIVCWKWYRNEPSGMKRITPEEVSLITENRRFLDHRRNFSWKNAIKNRQLLAMLVSFFCSQWALYFFVAWMPVYLQQGRHFSENNMKMVTSYLFLAGMTGAFIAGAWSDWLVKKRGLNFGRRFPGFFALGMTGLCFLVTAFSPSNLVVVISLIVGDFFLSFFPIAAFSTCADIAGSRAGTVAGIMNFSGQMGAFLLAIAFGKIVDLTHSYNSPLIVISVVLITGGMCWLAVNPTKKISMDVAVTNLKLVT